MSNKHSREMFPEIIETREQQFENIDTLESATFSGIFPGTIEVPHNNEVIKVKIPPLGLEDYYALSRNAKLDKLVALNAFELSSLFIEAYDHPFQTYSNRGEVVGLNHFIDAGRNLKLVPKLVTPGDIIRNENNYSWTGLLYIPSKTQVLGSNGGAFVFDFTDPELEIDLNDLVTRLKKGDSSVRFVPGEQIPKGRDIGGGWKAQNDYITLTSDEFKEEPLANAILTKNGALNLSKIKKQESQQEYYKPIFVSQGNFHLYYHSPEKINFPYPAIVSICQSNGVVYLNASNKSVGNKGFDAFSKIPLLAKGFLYCKTLYQVR